jgi:asparagine N-glycosylation enzyme membrane subunit Stt3
MYFGSFLIGVGVVLSVFVWWVFFIFLVIFLFIYTIQTRKEEKELLARFDDEYKRYCQVTPKYFPNLFNLFSEETKSHIFLRLKWIKKELASLLTVIFILIIVEVWQDIKLYGHSELLKEPLEIFLTIFIVIMAMFLFLRKKKVIIAK